MPAPFEAAAIELFEEARAGYGEIGKAIPHETMMHIIGVSQAASAVRQADALERIANRLEAVTTLFEGGGQINVGAEGNINVSY